MDENFAMGYAMGQDNNSGGDWFGGGSGGWLGQHRQTDEQIQEPFDIVSVHDRSLPCDKQSKKSINTQYRIF